VCVSVSRCRRRLGFFLLRSVLGRCVFCWSGDSVLRSLGTPSGQGDLVPLECSPAAAFRCLFPPLRSPFLSSSLDFLCRVVHPVLPQDFWLIRFSSVRSPCAKDFLLNSSLGWAKSRFHSSCFLHREVHQG
jgi:hypothetical protein